MQVYQFQRGDKVRARVTIGDIAPGTHGMVVHVLSATDWYEVEFNGVHRKRFARADWLEPVSEQLS